MKPKLYFIILISLSVGISSCTKSLPQLEDPNPPSEETVFGNLIVSDNFNWETSITVSATIQTLDNTGVPISHVKVSLNTDYELFAGKKIISGYTNASGVFEFNSNIASAIDSLVVSTDYLGFVRELKIPIIDGKIDYTFGGVPVPHEEEPDLPKNKSSLDTDIDLETIGKWYNDGTPKYLEKNGDHITSDFLAEINTAFPENKPVPQYHPEYLENNYDQNIYLNQSADVWVTFVAEGAGYLNTLAYYTFDKNDPPQEMDDIDEATIIFPNASFKNSGGGLNSGDKVYLGQFSAGTSIGWLLIADGYEEKGHKVTDGENYFFSHKNLNPEHDKENQQHVVVLKDAKRNIFVISFEDMERPDGDADFNDVIFYATCNPASAVDDSSIPIMGDVEEDTDADDDGVEDNFDDYPNDAAMAFNNYYPSQGNYATLAFEDLWPSKGDYDFNDLVLDYNFNTITNADNKVVKLKGTFSIRAIGAGFHNGFGFELENILSNQIQSVTGTELQEGYISLNGNGTETGQKNATIIVFDDAKNHGNWNTDPTTAYIPPTELFEVVITLTAPIAADQFGLAPFNPFIIVNKERGREIHMANYSPTDLVNLDYFGTFNDDSNEATGKYYKTTGNLPWVINIPTPFDYPIEKVSIATPYLKFIPWVESSGTLFTDWYLDLPSYRNSTFIY